MSIYKFGLSMIFAFYCIARLSAQTYFTKDGEISFYSYTAIEEIEAKNDKAVSVLNIDESKIEFSVLIKGFHFKNALMQTHFNENYMDSDQYPKAVFKSEKLDFSGLYVNKDGTYKVPVRGRLTIKGKEKEITAEAIFTVAKGAISGVTSFVVSPADYGIEIPSLVRGKIAEEIKVSVSAEYKIYEKS